MDEFTFRFNFRFQVGQLPNWLPQTAMNHRSCKEMVCLFEIKAYQIIQKTYIDLEKLRDRQTKRTWLDETSHRL